MASWLNPFTGFIWTQEQGYRPSRTLRTSFGQKLLDTFCVFAGGIHGMFGTPALDDAKDGDHVGVLDFIWPSYRSHNGFWKWYAENRNKPEDQKPEWYELKWLGFFTLNFVLNLPKYIIAAVLTLFSALVILPIIQFGYVGIERSKLKNIVYKIMLKKAKGLPTTQEESNISLRKIMTDSQENLADIETLRLRPLKTNEEQTEEIRKRRALGIDLIPNQVEFNFSRDLSAVNHVTNSPHKGKYTISFNIAEDGKIHPNQEAYKALFELDLAQITTKVEEEGIERDLWDYCSP